MNSDTTDRARDFKLLETGFSYWATTLNRVAARQALGRIKKALADAEAALLHEREEAAGRASEYLNTLNAREDCTHDGLRDAILGPDPQSPAPMGGEARKC